MDSENNSQGPWNLWRWQQMLTNIPARATPTLEDMGCQHWTKMYYAQEFKKSIYHQCSHHWYNIFQSHKHLIYRAALLAPVLRAKGKKDAWRHRFLSSQSWEWLHISGLAQPSAAEPMCHPPNITPHEASVTLFFSAEITVPRRSNWDRTTDNLSHENWNHCAQKPQKRTTDLLKVIKSTLED